MAYLVVAYPKLKQHDFEWIQAYRRNNDPRYFEVVDPHFTLLFAIDDIEKDDFIAEVKKQTEGIQPFGFTIRVATINQNDDGKFFHEFLVPDEGYSNIVKIHDKLYSGLFRDYLRLDIDFIPHIGIGNSDEGTVSLQRVKDINVKDIEISGTVDTIIIIEYTNGRVTTVEEIKL